MRGEGEAFRVWRQPRLRMPKRSGSKQKRVRSPPHHRGSDSSDRGGEETATDMEMYERHSKQREDARLRRCEVMGFRAVPPRSAVAKRLQICFFNLRLQF